MKLKKINAVLGLLTTLSLFAHAGIMSISLHTGWYQYTLCKGFARLTLSLMILHIVCSLAILFFYHDGSEAVLYKKANVRLILQRASALCLMIFLHVHRKAYGHMATGETLSTGMAVFFMISEIIYICLVMIHISMSFSKAFITLGIVSSTNQVAVIDRIIWGVCIVLLLVAGIGVAAFFTGGIV